MMRNFYIEKKSFRPSPIYFRKSKYRENYYWETDSLDCPFSFCVNFETREYISLLSMTKDDIGKKLFDDDDDWNIRKKFEEYNEKEMLEFVNQSFDSFHIYYMQKMKEYVDRIFDNIGKDIRDSDNPLDMF